MDISYCLAVLNMLYISEWLVGNWLTRADDQFTKTFVYTWPVPLTSVKFKTIKMSDLIFEDNQKRMPQLIAFDLEYESILPTIRLCYYSAPKDWLQLQLYAMAFLDWYACTS